MVVEQNKNPEEWWDAIMSTSKKLLDKGSQEDQEIDIAIKDVQFLAE